MKTFKEFINEEKETLSLRKISDVRWSDDDAQEDGRKIRYTIVSGKTVVGALRVGSFGTVNGELYGRPLPELTSYSGSSASEKLQRFLQSATGKKWLARSGK